VDLDSLRWRKSSYSDAEDCVEVGHGTDVVGVRDTKDRGSRLLIVPESAWHVFADAVARMESCS
jgi:hypothetical protein